MADVIDMQGTAHDVPDEEKASNVSYWACHNSYVSQTLCWRH